MMSKKSKMTLMIIVPIIGILAVFIAVLSNFVKETEEIISYPAGNLSDSIFDSQNMEYIENSLFTKEHEFKNLPYTIDTVNTECARIGNGSVYAQGDYYLYYSEIRKTDTMRAAIVREFSQVLNYGIDETNCHAERLLSEEGFLNGFRVLYEILELSVPDKKDSTKERKAYVLSYRLEMKDDDKFAAGHDIVIGMATELLSNETLEKCKQLLDMSIYTIQYSPSLAKDIETEIKNGNIEGELILKDEINDSDSVIDNENDILVDDIFTESSDSGILKNELPDSEGEKNMGILLKQDYKDLSLVIDWENSGVTPELMFCDVREEETYLPVTRENGRAVFNIGTIEAGIYMVTIKGWEGAGTFTSHLVGD